MLVDAWHQRGNGSSAWRALKTHELQSVHGCTNVPHTALHQTLQRFIGRNAECDTRVAPFGSQLGTLGSCNLLKCLEHVGMGYRVETYAMDVQGGDKVLRKESHGTGGLHVCFRDDEHQGIDEGAMY